MTASCLHKQMDFFIFCHGGCHQKVQTHNFPSEWHCWAFRFKEQSENGLFGLPAAARQLLRCRIGPYLAWRFCFSYLLSGPISRLSRCWKNNFEMYFMYLNSTLASLSGNKSSISVTYTHSQKKPNQTCRSSMMDRSSQEHFNPFWETFGKQWN